MRGLSYSFHWAYISINIEITINNEKPFLQLSIRELTKKLPVLSRYIVLFINHGIFNAIFFQSVSHYFGHSTCFFFWSMKTPDVTYRCRWFEQLFGWLASVHLRFSELRKNSSNRSDCEVFNYVNNWRNKQNESKIYTPLMKTYLIISLKFP